MQFLLRIKVHRLHKRTEFILEGRDLGLVDDFAQTLTIGLLRYAHHVVVLISCCGKIEELGIWKFFDFPIFLF